MRQQYNEIIVNKTSNLWPCPEAAKQTSTSFCGKSCHKRTTRYWHTKRKTYNIFDGNYQYYIKKELKDSVIPTKAKKMFS